MGQRLGISLSGGGFRATLFHLGVVAALRKLGRLEDVSVISCVSGGSITGAHLVLNWERYTGPDDAFEHAARQLIQITKADIRGRIVRRLPRRRHASFERFLDQFLFSRALLSDTVRDGRPALALNTTDLKHGTAAAFVGRLFLPDVRRPTLDNGQPNAIDVGSFSLSAAVACSAGFPALFPAREVSARDFAQPRKKWEAGASLSDGGIYDNLGVQYFLGLTGTLSPPDFLVSDAGAPFDYQAGLIGNIVSRTARITDVQMELLRLSVIEDAAATPMKIHLISVTDEPLDRRTGSAAMIDGIPRSEIVRHLQFVRTDLDEFSDLEIDLLLRHGFTVAYKVLTGDLAPTASVKTVWSAIDAGQPADAETVQRYASSLARSQKRRWRLFNPKDRAFPLPWLLILFALLLGTAIEQVCAPFLAKVIRSPIADRIITGRPYRLTRVLRHVALAPAPENGSRRGIIATSRLFYWLRLNQHIAPSDSTFTEILTPTYERSGSVHGLGVMGANAIRESDGTLPFDVREELTFEGARGATRLLATGVSYEFDWPGARRSLEKLSFDANGDYWAYENQSDYIDDLEIIVESRSDRLLVSQSQDCAVLYRANRLIERSPCLPGENNGAVRAGLPLYGGALVAQFTNLKPGDEAIIKYEITWREQR